MAELDTTQLLIADAPQYFFDNGIIESVQNVTRTIHSPVRSDANPLLRKDKPWEHVPYFGSADYVVWRDSDSGEFRCLYTDWQFDRERYAAGGASVMDWGITLDRQLYARSSDGLSWEKPAMGLAQHDGSDTNIVLGGEDYGTVWNLTLLDDPLEPARERRFKALYSHIPPGAVPEHGVWETMKSAFSADGIHWTPHPQAPSFGRLGSRLGDVAIVCYDPETQTYLLNTRHPWQEEAPGSRATAGAAGPAFDATLDVPDRRARRRIFQCESRDFLHWSEPRLILSPDPELDNLDDCFYGLNAFRLGNEWVGFLDVFHMVANTVDVQLVHSRDGRRWRRITAGKPWLTCGDTGTWDEFMSYHVHGFPVDNETWFYYGGARHHHDWWITGLREGLDVPEASDLDQVAFGLGLAKLRRDGFVSLGANHVREGMIATQPFVSSGAALTINAACRPRGYIKVELCDIAGEPLPGRSFDASDTFRSDSVRHLVRWQGDPALSMAIEGDRPPWRRLRFILRDAELYSFCVHMSEPAA